MAGSHFDDALESWKGGATADAGRLCRLAAENENSRTDALRLLAEIHIASGRLRDAIAVCRQLVDVTQRPIQSTKNRNTAKPVRRRARRHLAAAAITGTRPGQPAGLEALASFDRAVESSQTFAKAHAGRGLALAAVGRGEEAISAYLRATQNNAHTTASDALVAGVPIITLRGRSFAARVATSLLHAVGLSQLSVENPQSYAQLTIDLARAPGEIARLKDKLRAMRSTTSLFDPGRYCRHLEAAYFESLRRHGRGEGASVLRIERLA